MNFDGDDVKLYDKIVKVVIGMGPNLYSPKKLDLDVKKGLSLQISFLLNNH